MPLHKLQQMDVKQKTNRKHSLKVYKVYKVLVLYSYKIFASELNKHYLILIKWRDKTRRTVTFMTVVNI